MCSIFNVMKITKISRRLLRKFTPTSSVNFPSKKIRKSLKRKIGKQTTRKLSNDI